MPAPPSMMLELGNIKNGSSCLMPGTRVLQGWLSLGCLATACGVISVFQLVFKCIHTLDPRGASCLFVFSPVYPGGIRISIKSAFLPTFLCYAILFVLRYVFVGSLK